MAEVPLEQNQAIDPKVEEAIKAGEPMPGLEKFFDREKGEYRNEDIQKSYLALQKSLGKKEEPKDENTLSIGAAQPEEEPPVETPEIDPEAVITDAGLDQEALQQEYAETGELSTESRSKILEQLKPLGVDEAGLDLYLEAQAAKQTKAIEEIQGVVGGADEYNQRIEWAQDNLSPDEIQAFNAAVAGDPAGAKLAVQGLDARYREVVGSPPRSPVSGRKPGNSGVKPFASQMEATQATMDPRYRTDAAYQREVLERQTATLRLRNA